MMHTFFSTRPTRAYDYSYAAARAIHRESSAIPMRVLPIERRRKNALVAQLLRHPYRTYIMALAIAVALSTATAWAGDLPDPHQQGDVSYISGGIGSDETEAMALVKKDYNLYLTSTDSTGHYLAGSRLIIRTQAGGVMLDVVTHGPLFYAHVPSGRYVIESFNGTASQKQSIAIASGKSARLNFSWPTISAEKAQAPAASAASVHIEPTIISPDPITIPEGE